MVTHYGKYGELHESPEAKSILNNNKITGDEGDIEKAGDAENVGDRGNKEDKGETGDVGDAGHAVHTGHAK